MNTLTIKIDCQKCLSCGTCSALAPKTFTSGKDGKAKLLPDPSKWDPKKVITDTVNNCPTGALSVKS